MPLRPSALVLVLACSLAAVGEEGYDSPGRARLGIGMTSTSLATQGQDGLEPGEGVQVAFVFPGTAAARLGIRPGDVIVAVDGEPIRGLGHMVETITSRSEGDPAEVTVARDGRRLSLGSAPLSGWPPGMSIPRIDPADERAMQDQQRRELERRARDVADLRRQLAEFKADQAAQAARPRDAALDEGMAALIALPPWRLDLCWRGPDAAAADIAGPAADAGAPAGAAAEAAAPAAPPWRLDHSFDSSLAR